MSALPTPPAIPPRFVVSRMVSSVWIPQTVSRGRRARRRRRAGRRARSTAHDARAEARRPPRRAAPPAARALRARAVSPGRRRALRPDRNRRVSAQRRARLRARLGAALGRRDDVAAVGTPDRLRAHRRDGAEAARRLRVAPSSTWPRIPEEDAIFNRSMQELTRGVAAVLAASYDFSGARTVSTSAAATAPCCRRCCRPVPAAARRVYDLPPAREGARRLFAEAGLADRCDFVGRRLLRLGAGGADLYLLKSVIHDWDDAKSRTILANVRDALRAGARLLLLEWPVPERVGPARRRHDRRRPQHAGDGRRPGAHRARVPRAARLGGAARRRACCRRRRAWR